MLKSFCSIGLVSACLLALTGCGTKTNPVGDYIVSDSSGAFLIQFTHVEGDAVEGVLTTVSLDKRGYPQSNTVPLSGTLRDHSINLVAKVGTGMFATSSSVTGTFSGDDLKITLLGNGKSVPLTLHRAEPETFPKLVRQLALRSSQVHQSMDAQAREREKQMRLEGTQANIKHLTDRLNHDIQELSTSPANIAADAASYPEMKSQIRKLKIEMSSIPANSELAGVKAGRINIEIQRIARTAEQKHQRIQEYWTGVRTNVRQVSATVTNMLSKCEPSYQPSCDLLQTTFGGYQNAVARVGDAASQEMAAFNAQSKKSISQ